MLAHIDLDTFFASVEELDNPQLKGLPLIVGRLQGRGVVSACSYAARKYGVRSAMPIFEARRLCPQAVFLPVRMARYRELSRKVMAILDSFSPLLEQVSIDEAFSERHRPFVGRRYGQRGCPDKKDYYAKYGT